MAGGVQDVAVGVMWPGPCRRMPVCCFEGRPRSQPYAQPGQFGREGGLGATDSRKGKKEQIRMTIAKQVRVLSFYPLLRPPACLYSAFSSGLSPTFFASRRRIWNFLDKYLPKTYNKSNQFLKKYTKNRISSTFKIR